MSTKLKILIVGGNSFVGSSIARSFVSKFHVFSTFHRSYTPIKGVHYIPLPPLTEKDRCERFIRSLEPDVVIYCLGTNAEISGDEKEIKKAQSLHSGGLTHLVHAIDMLKAKIIYISSDYVFSGEDGNFNESMSTIPFNNLGKAKASGESVVRSQSLNNLIVRCAPLLGRGTIDHPSWLDQYREKIVREKKLQVPSRNLHNPVHVSFLIEVVEKAIEKDLRNRVLHVGGLTKTSFFEVAKLLLEKLGLPPELVERSDASSTASILDYTLNFTETLGLVEAKPLLLKQSFDLFQ